jgi:hypothetical protein
MRGMILVEFVASMRMCSCKMKLAYTVPHLVPRIVPSSYSDHLSVPHMNMAIFLCETMHQANGKP